MAHTFADPRRPALPYDTEPDPDHVLVMTDGSVRENHVHYFSRDDVERFRTGYCCINCYESQVDHGAPFPEQCWVCGYPMRDKQIQFFAKTFVGEVRLGPTTTVEEELAIAEEMVARERLDRAGFKTTESSIVVPKGVF